jgi:hypothetical protein
MANRTNSNLASTSRQGVKSRFGTGLIKGCLKGFRLVKGDIVLPDFLGGRESEIFINQGNIDAISLGALDGRHVLGCIEKILELRTGYAPICSL